MRVISFYVSNLHSQVEKVRRNAELYDDGLDVKRDPEVEALGNDFGKGTGFYMPVKS